MRNPNGYGSVVKLSGKRRRPFVARKTVGWNARGHPIYKPIGYYPTREDGLKALGLYNNDPYDLDAAKTTLEELFERWKKTKGEKLGKSNRQSLYSAFKHCRALHKMEYKTIRAFHMQKCIDECGKGYSTQGAIKNLLRHLDRFALELDIISKCYSDLLISDPIPDTSKVPFSDEEIEVIWKMEDRPWVDSILAFLYTGFRISELLDLRTEDVDLEQGTIRGGKKTSAGKNRIVPIHSKIRHIIENRMAQGGEFLFGEGGKKISSTSYYTIWKDIMDTLGMKHTPHECRHAFCSRLDSAGANRKCRDMLMGHKSKEVGDRVYTHKTIEELKETIELIK